MSTQSSHSQVFSFEVDSAVTASGYTARVFNRQVYANAMTAGTAASQFQVGFAEVRTITGTTAAYTLSSLADGSVFAVVREINVVILTAIGAGGTATIGPGATHGWTAGLGGPIPLTPGGKLSLCWPDAGAPAVAAGSNDQITITATGTIQFLIEILGY